MSNNKVYYVLQKDLPGIEKGDLFELPDGYKTYHHVKRLSDGKFLVDWKTVFPQEIVENSPEWFLSADQLAVNKAKELLESKGYHIYGDPDVGRVNEIIANFKAAGRGYTEEDMINCWKASLDSYLAIKNGAARDAVIESPQDYLKSLNK